MNLIIQLDSESKVPMYEQLYLYMKQSIMDGDFSTGERLPSTRVLAQMLGVSRNTIDRCYEQLRAEGYIEAVPCSGFLVCRVDGLIHFEEKDVSETFTRKRKEEWKCDFTIGGIDVSSFPTDTIRKIGRVVLRRQDELLRSGDPFGEEELREEIARYLRGARGVVCKKDQIIVGAGNDYLLMLLTKILNRENVVAMEYPTYMQAYHVLKDSSCKIVHVSLDRYGLSVEALKGTSANLVYVMPSHQFPMGTVMPMSRRMDLLRWAYEKKERYIIEDDYDSELRYRGKPIPALQGSDEGGRVIYLGTFSQSIAPSIRISYMVLPAQLVSKYHTECGVYSNTVSRLQQEIVKEFMKEGYFERHLNRMRKRYKIKRDLLLRELNQSEKSDRVLGADAGTHIVLRLPEGLSEEVICKEALKKGVHVKGIHEYIHKKTDQNSDNMEQMIVLSYGGLCDEQIRYGAAVIREIIK